MKLPDAIHVATANEAHCRYFVTSDTRIRTPRKILRLAPDETGVAQVLGAVQ